MMRCLELVTCLALLLSAACGVKSGDITDAQLEAGIMRQAQTMASDNPILSITVARPKISAKCKEGQTVSTSLERHVKGRGEGKKATVAPAILFRNLANDLRAKCVMEAPHPGFGRGAQP